MTALGGRFYYSHFTDEERTRERLCICTIQAAQANSDVKGLRFWRELKYINPEQRHWLANADQKL